MSVSPVVRAKAIERGALAWIDGLPDLIAALEADWSITAGQMLTGGTESVVLGVTQANGEPAVLKLVIPGIDLTHEIAVLRMADGRGCAELLRHDADRSALLLERLGLPLAGIESFTVENRQALMCAAAQRLWAMSPDEALPTAATKAQWLIDFINRAWGELSAPGRPRAFDYALECAGRRLEAFDPERAVVVHGDIHAWNTLGCDSLEPGGQFKLIDPDGLFAEPEYDLGVILRESGRPDEARRLGLQANGDAQAIWEWCVVERMSTALLCLQVGMAGAGWEMLNLANRCFEW